MTDLKSWLNSLGLQRYFDAFDVVEVEFEDIPHLREDDLKEMGLPLGPRRRLIAVIEALATDSSADRPGQDAGPFNRTSDSAERRHLTVMFIDLVESTAMATKIDPEEMRRVITDFQNAVAGVVARYEGFVAKFMGDGVLCYFGWPRAHENDAERAVRAALEAVDVIRRMPNPAGGRLDARVGIASGIVVVGDMIGSGASREASVVGETPNLAARLQGIAAPGEVVISDKTLDLLGDAFSVMDLGARHPKGYETGIRAFAVGVEKTQESRFEARHKGALHPIVGRKREIELIHQHWNVARDGRGQMVLVSGEAGIGKSRVVRAVIGKIAQEDHRRITYQCSPYHTESAFYPIIQNIRRACNIQNSDGNDTRLDKLEALIGSEPATGALLSPLLGLNGGARYGALNLTPAQQRARTMEKFLDLLLGEARQSPLLVVMEDMHWIDPTTQELVEMLLDAIAERPVMILATARPVFQHTFGSHPAVSRYLLNRLGSEDVLAIAESQTGGRRLPDEVLDVIVARTDGVPLFVEELTKTVLESGVLVADGAHLALSGPLDAITIPHTLHDSLMARLDRLKPVKEIAQIAACIGRSFGHKLLAQVAARPADALKAALDELIRAELIYRRGVAPGVIYLFKHALVRDAAYDSLLRESRRAVHARILAALRQETDAAPEVMAQHAENAGLTDEAVELWEAASTAALQRPAYDEGIANLERAIALVDTGGGSVVDKARRSLDLHVLLGIARLARNGYGGDETKAVFERALELADQVGPTPARYPILNGLWVGMHVRGEHAAAERHARELVALAEAAPDTAPLVVAHRVLGVSLGLQGNNGPAQTHLNQALTHYDPDRHTGLEDRFGQDIGTAVNCYQAINHLVAGRTVLSRARLGVALRQGRSSGHVNTLCYVLSHAVLYGLYGTDQQDLRTHLPAVAALAREHRLTVWEDYCAIFEGVDRVADGDPAAVAALRTTEDRFLKKKSRAFLPVTRVFSARAMLAHGWRDDAQQFANRARSIIAETGENISLADCHHLQGEIALADGDRERAEECFLNAHQIAAKQGTRLYQTRAAIELARLWQGTERASEGADFLRDAFEGLGADDCPRQRRACAEILPSIQ